MRGMYKMFTQPFTFKVKKTTLIIAALVAIALSILFFVKTRPKPEETVVYDYYTIDALTMKLQKQSELNDMLKERIQTLELQADCTKVKLDSLQAKLITIKQKKDEESTLDYLTWNKNEFTKFLSNRYHNQ